jgi:hypothetical protein
MNEHDRYLFDLQRPLDEATGDGRQAAEVEEELVGARSVEAPRWA